MSLHLLVSNLANCMIATLQTTSVPALPFYSACVFTKKISESLKNGNNIELRGFGTLAKKINKEKFVRNPKTNEKIFKKESFKIHFKIGKLLHKKININNSNVP